MLGIKVKRNTATLMKLLSIGKLNNLKVKITDFQHRIMEGFRLINDPARLESTFKTLP